MLSYNQHKNGGDGRQSASVSRQGSNVNEKEEEKETNSKAVLRDEFLINMQKFASSIMRTSQQIEGEVRLEVPELTLSDNMDENLKDEELMGQIENACRNWFKQIGQALELQQKKVPQGNGPLAEIDYWRERNAALSALYEQLRLPKVKLYLELFSNMDNSFEYLKQDLNKFYTEAKDNVRFLSTLERHFKNITHGASFQVSGGN